VVAMSSWASVSLGCGLGGGWTGFLALELCDAGLYRRGELLRGEDGACGM
jgi:hypothetical protein